jgi:hypothetical protein
MPRWYFDVKSGIDWWTRLESIAPVTAKPNNRPGLLRLRLHGTIAQDVPASTTRRRVSVIHQEGSEVTAIKVGE